MARLDDDSDLTSQHWVDSYSPTPKYIQAAPQVTGAQLGYAKPNIQTYSANTGVWSAPTGSNTPYANPRTNFVGNTGGGGPQGMVGTGGAPAAPAKPKIDYTSADWLNGSKDSELDSTFHDQQAMYSAKLKRYIADYEDQVGKNVWGKEKDKFDLNTDLGGSVGTDYRNSHEGILRNKDLGLKGLSEDFANRGMINSGLYLQDHKQSGDQYDRQDVNLGQQVRNQVGTLNFNRGNQETDNTAQIAAARRDSLNRLAQAQSLT